MTMIEHKRRRCWAYRVPSKGVLEDAHWFPERMIQDSDGIGMRHDNVQMKSDQELAIISMPTAIHGPMPNAIFTNNSSVGWGLEDTGQSAFLQATVRAMNYGKYSRQCPNHGVDGAMWCSDNFQLRARDGGSKQFEIFRHEVCAPLFLAPVGEAVMYLLHILRHEVKREQ